MYNTNVIEDDRERIMINNDELQICLTKTIK